METKKLETKKYEKPVLHAQKIEFTRPSGVTCAVHGAAGDCIGNLGGHNPGNAGSPALS